MAELNPDDFTLVELNEEDPKQSKIARSNIKTEFTVALIEEHRALLEKSEKELSSQLSLCEATVNNIFKHHKALLKMTPETIHHVWMLKENLDVVEVAKPKLEEVRSQMAQYDEMLVMLKEKFNLPEDVTPSETEGK